MNFRNITRDVTKIMLEAEYLTHVLALIGTLNIPEKVDHVWYIEYNNRHHQK